MQKEWTKVLALDRPDLAREKIERVRALMEQHIPEATVEWHDQYLHRYDPRSLRLKLLRDAPVLRVAFKAPSAG